MAGKKKVMAKVEPAAPVAPATVFGAPAGGKMLGEIVTWTVSGGVSFAGLTASLRSNGLDEKAAREMAPRHAFTRACSKLSDQRIIRRTDEDAETITFQFTRESKVGDQYQYDYETKLVLNKQTGDVTCEKAELAAAARVAIDEQIANRTAGDVTTVIQKLFDKHADLFRIREQGGCYFVPDRFADFLTKIEGFVTGVNGTLRRFPVPAGTAHGDRSVREAVVDGLNDVIAEHAAAIENFGFDTRDKTFESAAERIKQTRFKIEAYAEYLGEQRAKLEAALAEAAVGLRKRVAEIASTDPWFLAESDDAWAKAETADAAVAEMRKAGEYPAGTPVAYKLWKVHPATTVTPSGKMTCPVSSAAPPELVGEFGAAPTPTAPPKVEAPKPAAPAKAKPEPKPAAPKAEAPKAKPATVGAFGDNLFA